METHSRRDMDWIRNIQWDQLTSTVDHSTPWTDLWRKASYFYAHDEQFWTGATAVMLTLAIVGVVLLAWMGSFAWSRFSGSTPPVTSEERKLVTILEVVKRIDASHEWLQRISEAVKNPIDGTVGRARTLPNGHVLIEDSEVTGRSSENKIN